MLEIMIMVAVTLFVLVCISLIVINQLSRTERKLNDERQYNKQLVEVISNKKK